MKKIIFAAILTVLSASAMAEDVSDSIKIKASNDYVSLYADLANSGAGGIRAGHAFMVTNTDVWFSLEADLQQVSSPTPYTPGLAGGFVGGISPAAAGGFLSGGSPQTGRLGVGAVVHSAAFDVTNAFVGRAIMKVGIQTGINKSGQESGTAQIGLEFLNVANPVLIFDIRFQHAVGQEDGLLVGFSKAF